MQYIQICIQYIYYCLITRPHLKNNISCWTKSYLVQAKEEESEDDTPVPEKKKKTAQKQSPKPAASKPAKGRLDTKEEMFDEFFKTKHVYFSFMDR